MSTSNFTEGFAIVSVDRWQKHWLLFKQATLRLLLEGTNFSEFQNFANIKLHQRLEYAIKINNPFFATSLKLYSLNAYKSKTLNFVPGNKHNLKVIKVLQCLLMTKVNTPLCCPVPWCLYRSSHL